MSSIRTYRELSHISDYEGRFEYLSLRGQVGETTFGFDRWINQAFYKSRDWKHIRSYVIVRDNGCDLGIPGYEIHSNLLIHHIEPISSQDITGRNPKILDPDNLITTTLNTHNAIHYGNADLLRTPLVERTVGDTKLW
jgi:hypothetical protein